MSVTFAVESLSTGIFTWACWESQEVTHEVTGGYDAAVAAAMAHQSECDGSCAIHFPSVSAVMDVDVWVDMHNEGASRVLDALGIEVDPEDGMCGSIDGQDFLGRVLLAEAISPADEGMPAHELSNGDVGRLFDGSRWVECGRPAGDLQRRLGDLRAVAEEAARLGRSVCWS